MADILVVTSKIKKIIKEKGDMNTSAATIEVLIPDFQGKNSALQVVIDAAPDIINHNLETVPRLYRRVRPGSVYKRSLELLSEVKKSSAKIKTKTGIMLGLGEEKEEVLSLMDDVRNYGIDIFTAGQYMQPSRKHLPVEKYLEISEFDFYRTSAEAKGIAQVFVGPLVRSSYHAEEFI